MMLGRGVDAPMPVILLGALGGMASGGILGNVCRRDGFGDGVSNLHGLGRQQSKLGSGSLTKRRN